MHTAIYVLDYFSFRPQRYNKKYTCASQANSFLNLQKKNRTPMECDFLCLLRVNSADYSAAASVAGASTAASALGAAFLPARRVVFLAAALGALSMFSL